ncbi:hypothetical protein HNQ80_002104 [Anaerosolibacter carboniphilus]|uniref:Uncharacterized protein n=1 Tax=Anaerosolibacter carboniphilus TaxID=1417629 RepID=A0A841KRK0_9FIRM|nr:hypothetical protein [Anaerosolibacter carboniphilus]
MIVLFTYLLYFLIPLMIGSILFIIFKNKYWGMFATVLSGFLFVYLYPNIRSIWLLTIAFGLLWILIYLSFKR